MPEQWPPNAIKRCKQWRIRFTKWRFTYIKAESFTAKRSNAFNVLQFIVLAMAPTTSFASFMSFLSEDVRLTIAGAVGALGILFKSLSAMLKFEERIKSLHETSIAFHRLSKMIESEMIASPNAKSQWDTFKQRIIEEHMRIMSTAPSIPSKIMDEAGLLSDMKRGGTSPSYDLTAEDEENTSKFTKQMMKQRATFVDLCEGDEDIPNSDIFESVNGVT